MAHVADPFAGGLVPGDPRDLIWSSGGCTWPTMPAWRLFLGSTNATGVLSFLNTTGILLEVRLPSIDPNNNQWDKIAGPVTVLDAFILKNRLLDPDGYQLATVITTIWGFVESAFFWEDKKCNTTHSLPEATVGIAPILGSTGDDFKIHQVVWDELQPPGGWPPSP